jgi:glycerophosphoryl diester phosphodiesterase
MAPSPKFRTPLLDVILVSNVLYDVEDRNSEILSEKSSGPASIKDIAEWNDSLRIDRDGVEDILASTGKTVGVASSGGIPTVTITSDEDDPFNCGSKDCTEKSGPTSVSS